MKGTKYKIIRSVVSLPPTIDNAIEGIQKEIQSLLRDGWQLAGPLTFTHDADGDLWIIQALIK